MKFVPLFGLLLLFSNAFSQEIDPGNIGGLYPELIWESREVGSSTWYPAQDCENAGSGFWVDFEREFPMTREFRIRNIGEAPAVVRNIRLTLGNSDFSISGEDCNNAIVGGCLLFPGGSNTFYIQYDPEVLTHGSEEVIRFDYGRSDECDYWFASYCPPCRGFDGKEKTGNRTELPDDLQVYPTVTRDILHLQFASEAQATSFQIFDLSGRPFNALSVKPNGNLYRLDVSNLAVGTYFIRDSFGQTKRFVVSR